MVLYVRESLKMFFHRQERPGLAESGTGCKAG